MKSHKFTLAVVLVSGLSGCGTFSLNHPKLAVNPPPSTLTSLSVKGEFTGEAHAQDDLGDMSVIFLKLRNDTDTSRSVTSSRIVGVTEDSRKMSLISRGEAERQSAADDKSSAWQRAGAGMAVGALGGAAFGGATGAIAGVVLGPAGMAAGAAFGAAVGGGTGAIVGAIAGALTGSQPESSNASTTQARIINRRLSDQVIGKASQADGYIFLPKDNYARVSLIVSSEQNGEEELSIPIASAKKAL